MEEAKEDFFAASGKELEQYFQDRLLLLKMQVGDKTASLVTLLFSVMVIGLLAFFILLFLSIMAGYYFAGLTGSLYTGFAIVAVFYLCLLGVLIGMRKWFRRKIINILIRIFFAKTDNDAPSH
jgi:hypothetical protein